MKSRFFSIPGLLIDVTDVVALSYHDEDARIIFRNSASIFVDSNDAKCVQEYTEEYEQHQFNVSKSLAASLMPSFLGGGSADA